MNKYKVRVTEHHVEIVEANTPIEAKAKVWNEIKAAYPYGYKSWRQFNKKAKIERL